MISPRLVALLPKMSQWQRMLVKRMLMESHPLVENYQLMLSCLLHLRACYWHLHYSRSQEMCSSGGTWRVTSMPVLGNGHRTIGAPCWQYHRECSQVFTPS